MRTEPSGALRLLITGGDGDVEEIEMVREMEIVRETEIETEITVGRWRYRDKECKYKLN
jgi:hypothetical protein